MVIWLSYDFVFNSSVNVGFKFWPFPSTEGFKFSFVKGIHDHTLHQGQQFVNVVKVHSVHWGHSWRVEKEHSRTGVYYVKIH
jgi:hypothetical protein